MAGTPRAQAAASSVVWEQPQAYYDSNHASPDDNVWVEYKLLRSGDTSGSASVTFSIAEATIASGNGPGQYELLVASPIVFSPDSTYALIRVRYHTANHDLFGTQHLTFSLGSSDAGIEDDQAMRTVYVDYPAMPVLAFASPPADGYRGVEGQGQEIVINVTKSGDALVDVYANLFAGGTANSGRDYTLTDDSGSPVSVPGSIRLMPGESVYTIHMTLLNDAENERNETAVLTIGNPINAAMGSNSSAAVTILEAGTATPVAPTTAPLSTPALGTLAPTPKPPTNTTPVPLPSPGFESWAALVILVVIAIGLNAVKK